MVAPTIQKAGPVTMGQTSNKKHLLGTPLATTVDPIRRTPRTSGVKVENLGIELRFHWRDLRPSRSGHRMHDGERYCCRHPLSLR